MHAYIYTNIGMYFVILICNTAHKIINAFKN